MIMATKLENDKNYLIIKMSWADFVATTDSWGMCYCCSKYDASEKYYYVAMVNDYYCKTCFDAWYNSKKYLSCADYQKERENYNKTIKLMQQKGVWNGEKDNNG